MADTSAKHRVAIIGCGRLGQKYADAYSTYPDTEIVAIAEYNDERRQAVGERFGITALYPDVHALLADVVPDIAAIVTPTKFYKEAVIACAEAGVKGISTDKPIAGKLSDADTMVEVCRERGIVYAGGNLQRAMSEVQEVAQRIHAGQYGPIIGASVHRWGSGEISGGGCQHVAVLTLLAGAEVDEVIAWGTPAEALAGDTDEGLIINGQFRLTNGLDCVVFGMETPYRGVDVWSEDTLIRWEWGRRRFTKVTTRTVCAGGSRRTMRRTAGASMATSRRPSGRFWRRWRRAANWSSRATICGKRWKWLSPRKCRRSAGASRSSCRWKIAR